MYMLFKVPEVDSKRQNAAMSKRTANLGVIQHWFETGVLYRSFCRCLVSLYLPCNIGGSFHTNMNEYGTVELNYDGEEKEPVVLPTRFPNLLVCYILYTSL
ncbi:hypothetical protein NQ117_10385 [Paenibacillus sp. SC116]|nr:hypothetical protein [Paenibacillus sp. SC116]